MSKTKSIFNRETQNDWIRYRLPGLVSFYLVAGRSRRFVDLCIRACFSPRCPAWFVWCVYDLLDYSVEHHPQSEFIWWASHEKALEAHYARWLAGRVFMR